MADKDASTEEENLGNKDESVETKAINALEDENSDEEQEDSDEDTESNDDDSDESDDEDDSDDAEGEDADDDDSDEEEETPEFTKAFEQIKGDSPEEYIPNLEEAYRKSSAQGKTLHKEKEDLQGRLDLVTEAVAKNPELAKALEDATAEGATPPTVDPALQELRQQREQEMTKSYEDFVTDHPELNEDTELQEELLENLSIIGDRARKSGKTVKMDAALTKAWAMMGKTEDPKAKLAQAAKDSASKPKSSPSKKSKAPTKQKLTKEQISLGQKFGLSEKQMLAQSDK